MISAFLYEFHMIEFQTQEDGGEISSVALKLYQLIPEQVRFMNSKDVLERYWCILSVTDHLVLKQISKETLLRE